MADENRASTSRNDGSHKPTTACSLADEKTRVAKEIISVLDESENVWKTVSEKQLVLHGVYAEQIRVSDKFTRYNLTCRNFGSLSENIEMFHGFAEIDEQVQILSQQLDEFEVKLERSGAIIKDFIRDMKVHIQSVKSSLEAVVGVKSMEELENVRIPSLEWTQSVPDPEIEALVNDWSLLQLDAGISHFLRELQALLQPPLLNVEENMDADEPN